MVITKNPHEALTKMDNKITETIIQQVRERKPESVDQLLSLVREKVSIPDDQIIEYIVRLHDEGRIYLIKPSEMASNELTAYLKTGEAYWYWITMILAVAAALTVFIVPEDVYPLVYIRYLLGAIFVLWLPGYSFTKALFPTEPPFKTSSETLDSIERVALSIGLSIALTPTVGLLLNYTPWGVRLGPIVLSLFTLTSIFATVAIIGEHKVRIEKGI